MKHDAKTGPSALGALHRTKRPRKPQKKAVKDEPNSIDMRLNVSDILDALPFYVMLIDEQHHILQANRAVQTQLGVNVKDIIAKYCPTVIHGLDEPWYACPLEEAAQKGQPVEREALDRQSGRWVRSAIYPTRKSTADGSRIFFHTVSDITDRKQADEQLRTSREELRDLSLHLESVREEERTKLAREMHDELGSLLTSLKIDLSRLAKRTLREQDLLQANIKSMYELVDEAIQTVKRISTELRPGVLDDLGLSAAIEWQAQELERRTEIKIEFTSSPKDIVPDRDRSTAIFRICQEALTNVIRHADATKVKVTLKEGKGRIILRISDNGRGIEQKHLSDPKAFGLIGMRERAMSWGGEVKISGTHGKGTVVAVSIPLKSGENPDAENTNCR
jgi:PAS domain S-box-containing protein